MEPKRQIVFVKFLHWAYVGSFVLTYWLSFWMDKLERPFWFLAGFTAVSWVPFRACPLTIWENKLREKLNLERRRFFALTNLIFGFIRKNFGLKTIPPYGTLYLIGILVIIKFLI